MIEEVKQKYIFVIHLSKSPGQVILVPESKDLTRDILDKKIEKDAKIMKLKGKAGLNVTIVRPLENISYIVEEEVEVVQAQLDSMKDAQAGNKIIKAGFRGYVNPNKRRG